MRTYQGKLLELIGFKHNSNYLHIRFFFEKDIDMYWKVDGYTARNIQAIIAPRRGYRYRLSLNGYHSPGEDKGLCILTETYCEESNSFLFPCSNKFLNDLDSIRNCKTVDELDKLVFKPISPLIVEEVPKVNEVIKLDSTFSLNKYTYKGIVFTAFIISLMVYVFLNYSHYFYLDKTDMNKEVSAESIEADKQTNIALLANSEITHQLVTIEKPSPRIADEPELDVDYGPHSVQELEIEAALSKTEIPYVKLENLVTYGLSKGEVALTFDDGPSKYSFDIVDILNQYEVGATFFYIGLNVLKYPDQAKYAHSNGYSIGGHSMNHVDLSKTSYQIQEDEIFHSMDLIEEITGEKPILFRPPYGAYRKQTKELIDQHEYKFVLWNNDPEDWKVRDANRIFENIRVTDVSGAIILLHESRYVIKALPRIIEYLQELDLKIVSLR